MLRFIAFLVILWVSASIAVVVLEASRTSYVNGRLCTLDRAIVSILDPLPGYKHLTVSQRRALSVDINSIVAQEPCKIVYPLLPKGS